MAIRVSSVATSVIRSGGLLTSSGAWSMTLWARLRVDQNTFQVLVDLNTGGASAGLRVETLTDGTSLRGNTYGSVGTDTSTVVSLSVGTWYRVGVVFDGSDYTVYAGAAGAALSSQSATTTGFTATELILGSTSGSSFWDGDIASVKTWAGVALTVQEMENEWAQHQPVRTSSLATWHPFIGPALDLVDYAGVATGRNFAALTTNPAVIDDPPIRYARSRGPRVTLSTPPVQEIILTGIASGEAFGSHTLDPQPVDVTATGIASTEAFGTSTIRLTVTPTGIPSAETFGSPQVDVQGVIGPTGIPSAEAFGAVGISPQALGPAGIASAEAFGSHALAVQPVDVTATGIPSAETFGTATIKMLLFATGIESAEAFGSPLLAAGPVAILLTGIESAEAFGTPLLEVTLDPTVRIRPIRATLAPRYELLAIARVPQVSGPPQLLDVDAIEWSTLTWSSTLSRPQELSVVVKRSSVTEPVAQRLRAPDRLPTELHLLRNGKVVFAGPLIGGQGRGSDITLEARGLLAYLDAMIVVSDLKYPNGEDQFTIAAALVNQWQALPYGDFGIDTSDVGTSGQLRTVEYLRDEIHFVGKRLQELGAATNGFDAEVDPVTRRLQLWSPLKGTDRSTGADAIVFDARNVDDQDGMFSLAPGDLASNAYGAATPKGADAPLWSEAENPDLLASYGRTAAAQSFSEIGDQADLNDRVSALRDARDQVLRAPGRRVRVTPDSDLDAYAEGDIVTYEVDALLGIGGAYRIRSRNVSVEAEGAENVDLEFV